MISIPALPSRFLVLFATLTGLFSSIPSAGADANGDLPGIASVKRGAVLQLTSGKSGSEVVSFGVFVSKNGLALVDLQALSTKDRPKVMVNGGSSINFGRILGVFPEQELALIKFDHAPKLSLAVAKKEPAADEIIALVTLDRLNPWNAKIPPVCGPVLAKRSELTPNSRVLRFTRVLSIGAGLSDTQRAALGPGRFAIDHEGELVAFTHGIRPGSGQTLITLAPIANLRDRIEALAKEEKDIGFPLSDADNPIDPVAVDSDFHPMNLAYMRQDMAETKRLMESLRSRHPESYLLKCRIADMGGDGLSVDCPEPQRDDPAERQVAMWQIRAVWLANNQRLEESIKARQKAIELSPKDFVADRFFLGDLLIYLDRREEAEKVFQEIQPFYCDDIRFLHKFNLLKLRQLKFDESEKLDKRISELEEIYTKR